MDRKIIISEIFEPAYNLGLEEYLIDTEKNVLYLWQNNNTIVIGRNQNPYKECDIKKINEDNINLVRRKSGGGAVFHDLGNLNFTIISPKREDNIKSNFILVNKALNNLGIDSVFNGRNDLLVEGKKISGNAFYEKNNIFCHHGTLLIDVNMEKLSKYLTVSELKLKSKGIDSIKSRVINLVDLNKNINVKSVKSALIQEYKNFNDDVNIKLFSKDDIKENNKIMEKVNLYKSWNWIYGESPKSNFSIEEKFDFGIISLDLNIEDGIINNSKVNTDSIIVDNFSNLCQELNGKEFKKENIINSIENNIESLIIKKNLIEKINDIE